jgi:hypothetical protein
MKYIIIFVLSLFLNSCGPKLTTVDPISNKKVKVYTAEEYSFQYPKTWRKFNLKNIDDKQVVSIAPADLIYSEYISSAYNSRGMKSYSTVYEGSKTYISLEQAPINSSLKTYLDQYLKSIESANTNTDAFSIQSNITEKNPTHFIEETQIKKKNTKGVYYVFQITKTHYYLHNSIVYSIRYTTTPLMSYKQDAELVFRSFKFIETLE